MRRTRTPEPTRSQTNTHVQRRTQANRAPPRKQKQRVPHSSGEPSLNAEDGRVGSEASSRNARSAAEAGAPHLPIRSMRRLKNEKRTTIAQEQSRTRTNAQGTRSTSQHKQNDPHSSGEHDRTITNDQRSMRRPGPHPFRRSPRDSKNRASRWKSLCGSMKRTSVSIVS